MKMAWIGQEDLEMLRNVALYTYLAHFITVVIPVLNYCCFAVVVAAIVVVVVIFAVMVVLPLLLLLLLIKLFRQHAIFPCLIFLAEYLHGKQLGSCRDVKLS